MSDRTEFEKRTQEILEEGTARLDGRTRSRLTQARHAALAQLERPARRWGGAWMPAGAGAAVAMLAVVLWVGKPQAPEVVADNGAVDDMVMLAEAPDFLDDTDDFEFYEWAADEIES